MAGAEDNPGISDAPSEESAASKTVACAHIPCSGEGMSTTGEVPAAGLSPPLAAGYGKAPKEGDIRPSDVYETEGAIHTALQKVLPWHPTVPSGLGMLELFIPARKNIPYFLEVPRS